MTAENSTRDWLSFTLPNAASYLEAALGEEGLTHLDAVVSHATARALNQAEAGLELQARAAASESRTKESAYSAGFKAGAQTNAIAAGRLEGLTMTTEKLIESAALASMERCMDVFASLAGDDPRLSLAAKLVLQSNMSSTEIVATASSIPDNRNQGNGWLHYMREFHSIGAPGSDLGTNGNADQSYEEKKDAFAKSIGITPGVKMKRNSTVC